MRIITSILLSSSALFKFYLLFIQIDLSYIKRYVNRAEITCNISQNLPLYDDLKDVDGLKGCSDVALLRSDDETRVAKH